MAAGLRDPAPVAPASDGGGHVRSGRPIPRPDARTSPCDPIAGAAPRMPPQIAIDRTMIIASV
jgi:hypothetical protein